MSVRIEYDCNLLDEETVKKITLITDEIENITFQRVSRVVQGDIELKINQKIVNNGGSILVKRTMQNRYEATIEILIDKLLYEEKLEEQVVVSTLDILRILDELRSSSANEKYYIFEKEVLKHFNLNKKSINSNNEILEICQLVSKLRKIYKNHLSAAYEFKILSKDKVFLKYKENELFIYLYENLIRDVTMTYKTAKENLKAFGIYKKYNKKDKDNYYYLQEYLDYYCQSPPLVRTRSFYVRKAMLLIPLYLASQTGQIIFPILATIVILIILYLDYLIGKNQRKYEVVCYGIKYFLYIVLGVIAIGHYVNATPHVNLFIT